MTKNRKQSFCDQIRQATKESVYSQADLSRMLGVNESTISRFFAGSMMFKEERLNELAELLGLKVKQDRRRR
ncbi:helix-turn-helix domain-containing protein [Poriferisphaera sp. WC338]|uniref:helix-turn-helix domain-containing protein n=1 Tax=Poriferisphaera sp. WC338 TaxID=3425129 RepID=UPI003D81A2AB